MGVYNPVTSAVETRRMAQVVGLRPLIPSKIQTPCHLHRGSRRNLAVATYSIHTWSSLQQSLNCSGKFSCLFSDNRKQVVIPFQFLAFYFYHRIISSYILARYSFSGLTYVGMEKNNEKILAFSFFFLLLVKRNSCLKQPDMTCLLCSCACVSNYFLFYKFYSMVWQRKIYWNHFLFCSSSYTSYPISLNVYFISFGMNV